MDVARAALARALPQLIYADIAGVCVDAARRTFEYVQQHEFLPIVVGGVYPTVDPAGSLSLPGVQVNVRRPERIRVTGYDVQGQRRSFGATGLWARVLQHELDHLEGHVFLDRLRGIKRDMIVRKIKKLARSGKW